MADVLNISLDNQTLNVDSNSFIDFTFLLKGNEKQRFSLNPVYLHRLLTKDYKNSLEKGLVASYPLVKENIDQPLL